MGSFRRLAAVILAASLATVACAPDASTAPATRDVATMDSGRMVDSVNDLKAVRLRNFDIRKSINKGVGKATGAVERGFDQAGGVLDYPFAEAQRESGRAGRTAMSSVVNTERQVWRNASGQIIDGVGNLIASIPLKWPSDIGREAAGQAVNAARGRWTQRSTHSTRSV
jgi:hypothetical protein